MYFKIVCFFSAIVVCIFLLTYCQQDLKTPILSPTFLNLADSVDYIGMETCQSCHNDIHHSFIHTGMGRSFDKATHTKSDAIYDKHALVYDEKSNFHYRPFFKDSTLYITEFRLEKGDTVHQRTEAVRYIVGSGQHTNSHIFDFNGYIFQAPITYYTQDKKWDMAPGFKEKNLRFSRLLTTECITCHNHFPDHVEKSMNKYNAMPSGIECERCHGPGSLHVREKLAGHLVDTSTQIDYTIVNPRHLARDLQMDLCQRCHLQGVAVSVEGKSFFDFKPGMKLSDIFNVFLPRYSNSHKKFIMASQADRLRMSPCFLESKDLTCITCHNPHKSVEITDNLQYNKACQQCHQSKKCSEKLPLRLEKKDNCVHCHMPRSGSIDIPHVNITDHYISKNTALKKETISEEKKEAIAQFLGLEILTKEKATALEMAQAYIALYDKYVEAEQMLDSAFYYLNQSTANTPTQFKTRIHYFFAKKEYASILSLAKTKDRASLQDGWTAYRIGEAFYKQKDDANALLYYKKAVEFLPFHLDFQEKLGTTYLNLQYLAEAKKVFEWILEENPKRKIALTNLGYLYATQSQFSEALRYYDQALALDPDYEQALLNKSAILLLKNQKKQAKRYLQQLLRLNPAHKEAKKALEANF